MTPFSPAPGSGGGTRLPVMEKAMRLLSARALSESELRRRLRLAGYPPSEVRDAADECLRRGYLNDDLLAADCANFCRERGMGRRAVRFRLRRRGIAAPVVDEVLAEEEPEAELSAALRACASKAPSLARETDPRKRREKLLRFLASRGFSAETARRALEKTERAGEEKELSSADNDDLSLM